MPKFVKSKEFKDKVEYLIYNKKSGSIKMDFGFPNKPFDPNQLKDMDPHKYFLHRKAQFKN